MDKELQNLLDNYEQAIYGYTEPIIPSIHQIHLLLDYVSQLDIKVKKQKEVINNAIEYINDNLTISSILDGEKYYTINNYSFDYRELLDILNEEESDSNVKD